MRFRSALKTFFPLKTTQGRIAARWFLSAAAFLLFWSPVGSLAQKFPEYKVKSAYLLNFARFIEWPASAFQQPSDPINIGIFGTDPFKEDLEQTFKNKTIRGRTIRILRFSDLNALAQCHLVFISKEDDRRFAEVLRVIDGKPVLTVGETEGFTVKGGMIQLRIVDQQVSFEINQAATQKAGLTPSVQVLKLGKVVRH